jgi:hypothetical protein
LYLSGISSWSGYIGHWLSDGSRFLFLRSTTRKPESDIHGLHAHPPVTIPREHRPAPR